MVSDIEDILSPVAQASSGCADFILDLRDAMVAGENAGKCVSCYFAIYHRMAVQLGSDLLPLEKWIQRHIEISVSGAGGDLLERMPVIFHPGEDLETFCRRMMDEVSSDRVYEDKHLQLSFAFVGNTAS